MLFGAILIYIGKGKVYFDRMNHEQPPTRIKRKPGSDQILLGLNERLRASCDALAGTQGESVVVARIDIRNGGIRGAFVTTETRTTIK